MFGMFAWVASRTIAARSTTNVPFFWGAVVLTQVMPLVGVLYDRTTVFIHLVSLAELITVVTVTIWLWRRRAT
jgi:hypothetical protein